MNKLAATVRDDGRAPRLLLLLGQSPFDPTSGAAQSTRLIAEVLARQGFEVQALATTACEGDLPEGHAKVLAELDLPSPAAAADGFVRFQANSIRFALAEVSPLAKHSWERLRGAAYDAEFARLLSDWKPDFLLTYGGDATDVARRRSARRAGVQVVFALHNLYYRSHPPAEVDAFIAPTRFLADAYGKNFVGPIVVLPPPLDPARIVGASAEAAAICFINPEPAKGALLVAQLADRLGRERPDIPLLVVGGRASAETLTAVGRDLGLDLTRYPNLLQVPPTGRVSEVWGAARLVLMPSVVREAAGRCALEAMLNGVVPLVSNQGGLAEIVGEAGIKLPPPPELSGRAQRVPQKIVDAWWDAMTSNFDNVTGRMERSAAARAHASRFTVESVGPVYGAWFRNGRPQIVTTDETDRH